ncbi:MAG TPA: MOSC domain-containing protein [Acidimicrobiales bacterium]|nr:MOSC domain-containing protein [Acidimicrobiales bacterium]
MPFQGEVVSIHIAPEAGAELHPVDEARVTATGIEGDRYASGGGKFSKNGGPGRAVTLVEAEALEALAREEGIELDPGALRRNIVTRDVPLNHLVGREFAVGDVVLRGVRLAEPCAYLAKKTTKEVLKVLAHRAGLRADVVREGAIKVGDRISPC